MTEQQFLALHTTNRGGNINYSCAVNVNYDDNVVGVPGLGRIATPDYILGITVTRTARSVNGSRLPADTDLQNILEGIEKVRFAFNGYDYALNIVSKAYYTGQGIGRNQPYFYFKVTPFRIPAADAIDTDPQLQRDTLIDFTPFIEDLEDLFANYNATLNNTQAVRRSYKIVVADRHQDTALPTNFTAIYQNTAEFAEVQDSLYYDTGWINARYNGTKTSAENYSGLVPSLAGRSFKGEVFSGNTTYDTFCLLRNDSRLFEDLFHTGRRDEPDYVTGSMGIYNYIAFPANIETVQFISGSKITGSIEIGDILILDNEKLKVRSVNQLATPYPELRVIRGWAGTADISHNPGTEFIKIERTDLFRFTNSRTRSSILDNNIIYTETQNITLHTDVYGTVYSQSICPQTLLLGIDDPTPPPSDRRLKTNLTFTGKSPSGLNMYTFEYIDQEQFGEGLYQGVMSDEIPPEAISIGADGYDRVDYSLLDVEYKKIET